MRFPTWPLVVIVAIALAIAFALIVIVSMETRREFNTAIEQLRVPIPTSEGEVGVEQISQQDAEATVRSIKYVRDPRTGLCYAVVIDGLTLVPCDQVSQFLGGK